MFRVRSDPGHVPGWMRVSLTSPGGIFGSLIVGIFLVTAVLAPPILGDAASVIDPTQARLGPSLSHPFGTDDLGRDVLLRVLVATRLTFTLTFGAVLIATVLGVTVGVLASVLGSTARKVLYQLTAAATAFPAVLLALLLATLLGRSGWAAMLGLAIAGIPGTARLTLNLTSSVAGSEFVAAADVVGVAPRRIMSRYIVPNVAEPIASLSIVTLGSSLLVLSALSFLGVGVQAPEYDWGQMLNAGLQTVYTSPMSALGPGIAIVSAGIGFSLFGESIAEGIDPRNRARILAGRGSSRGRDFSPRRTARPRKVASSTSGSNAGPLLEIVDLRVTGYRNGTETELVRGVDFAIAPGELVGIVGESGSGKSLTLSALAALPAGSLQTTSKRHAFHGIPLNGLSSAALNKRIGSRISMVFQDPMSSLNPALSIGSQLGDKLRAHTSLSRTKIRARMIAALHEVRIPEPERRLKQFPHELSGGQRQRVMIAMALLDGAEVILADEATTALDVSVQAQIVELLHGVNRRHGTTIVLVSHDLALVSQLCERVIVMYDGRIVEQGPMRQIVGNPQHPYTKTLLGAVPDLTDGTDHELTTITDYSWNTDEFRREFAERQDGDQGERAADERT